MTHHSDAYAAPFAPLLVKRLMDDCKIGQGRIAVALKTSRSLVNLMVNKAYIPPTMPDLRKQLEMLLLSEPYCGKVSAWLIDNGVAITDIWAKLPEAAIKRKQTRRKSTSRKTVSKKITAKSQIIINCPEVEMLTRKAKEHFKPLFKDPFPVEGGIEKSADIYMSEEHLFLESAIMDAATNGGFMAIIGDSGAGKTVIRKKCVEKLQREAKVNVISPDFINCELITSQSLLDAIIMDISSETPKRALEHKTRQVKRLLLERSNDGTQSVLIIEEAHVLHWETIRRLKRFYEMESGWKKLLGIILLGQTELNDLLDTVRHPELREVIRRIQVARINGLDRNMLQAYLETKFKRVGKNMADVIDTSAIDALSKKLLTVNARGKRVSVAYPQVVNNYIVSAMNQAAEWG